MKKMTKAKKSLLTLLFLAINIAIVVYIGLQEFNGDTHDMTFNNVLELLWQHRIYTLLALLCPFAMILLESLKVFLMIKKLSNQIRPFLAIKIVILCKYYDYVTPFATGGQPVQIYYLKKHGIPTGVAGALPMITYFLTQLAFFLFAIYFFIFERALFSSTWQVWLIAYIGLSLTIAMPLVIYIFSFFPTSFQKASNLIVKCLHKVKLIKDPEKHQKRAKEIANEYANSFKTMSKEKVLFGICFIISIFYQIIYCSIPYLVIKAFGIDASWLQTFAYCFFIYSVVAFIPTPGNSGATEISFAAIFTVYLSGGVMFWSMIFWRMSSYYIFVIIGLILILAQAIRKRKVKVDEKADYQWELPNPDEKLEE